MIQATYRPTLVVVGTGMAGSRVVREVLARDPGKFQIRMFGAEPHGTYNRVLLSTVLGGFQDPGSLWLHTREWFEEHGVALHAGVKADKIDPKNRLVEGRGGKVAEPYDVLVLATGSHPFVPPVPGADKQGVFVFRTLEDCNAIAARAGQCDRAVVLGGGLLGLEAARGLLSHDLEVTVVEAAPHLMPQQLDAAAGGLLRRKMEAMGVRVVTGTQAAEMLGGGSVTGVRLADGTVIEAGLVVVSCGVRPNVAEAKAAGLHVDRAVVVDDMLQTSEEGVYAVGECAQHRGKVYGLVDPIYEQAQVLADLLTGANPHARYHGSRLTTTLKVMGVDLTSLGEIDGGESISHLDADRGVYRKIVLRDGRLVGGILLGTADAGGRLGRLFRDGGALPGSAFELLAPGNSRDTLLRQGGDADLLSMADDTRICNCHRVSKGEIVDAIHGGCADAAAIGRCTKAGTGCGSCQPLLSQLTDACTPGGKPAPKKTRAEEMKERKNGLDILDDIAPLLPANAWRELTAEQKDLIKWQGLFFRKPTPGHFMLRLRLNAGQATAAQFREIADLSDEFGKGFCDLTTRQQIQLRWFTLADVSEIWRRLERVGLHSKQTGMDNVRGVCGCPVAGLTTHELLDATPVVHAYTDRIIDNREFTNLPRKFNVTITGCLENCCHTETQDLALVPAYQEGDSRHGFNVLVGGKQGSGGYRPAAPLDVFVTPEEAADVCAELTRIFRDTGCRTQRTRARFAFVVEDKGVGWVRAELERRLGRPLIRARADLRKPHHADHLGIHPQKRVGLGEDPKLHYVGMLVPVGRITTAQMRRAADIADGYGNGEIRITVGQNLVIPNVPEARLGALMDEPLFRELPFDPPPVLRGLVSCTGNDYCAMALIDTKGYALEIARELERRTAGKKVKPLTIHWSGCPAGCGLHQVATIGLQGCRSRVNGEVVDAAHVCINGRAGPDPVVATDVLYDVPVSQLADALEPLVNHLPRLEK